MITATEKPKTKVLSFRVSPELATGLKHLSKFRGTTDVEALSRTLQPFTELRNIKVLEKLRTAVELSVHKREVERLLDTIREPNEVPKQWAGLDVMELQPTPTQESPVVLHTVKVYEGQNTEQAITSFVELLWVSVVRSKEHVSNEHVWEDLTDPKKHLFRIGYVNLEHWALFTDAGQYNLWRQVEQVRVQRKDPSTPTEWAVYGWCIEHLPTIFEHNKPRDYKTALEEDVEESKHPDDLRELDGSFLFNVYPELSFEECVREWARIVVATVESESVPEGLVERLDNFAFMFNELRIEPKRKPRTYTRKNSTK